MDENAGPPDRVYYYFQSLACLSKYLRYTADVRRKVESFNKEIKNEYDFLAKLYGCICSDETDKTKKCPGLMELRIWGDRTYTLHLKPATDDERYGTVRIYFDWDKEKRKIIIGSMKHPHTKKDFERMGKCSNCKYNHACEEDEK